MKRKLARLFRNWAKRLDPYYPCANESTIRQIGITIHITKKDVRDWRKDHPECKSHRQGLRSLIEEAKWRVAGAIGRGLMKKKAIDFKIHSTLYVADVSGSIYLYAPQDHANEETAAEAEV